MWLRLKKFFVEYKYAIIAWVLILLFSLLGIHYGLDEHVIAGVVVLIGILGQAFAALIAWVGFIPLVGPIIAKVLALPFIWLLNGVGYLVSLVAIKRGYAKDVVNYRIITVTLIVGITIGYIIGKVI
ncbi:MAG: hypothetical protein HY966_00685 [Ignavibacteriales bacterium]|nr:hypothetical protein [Ignavibacteriales bacterium]